MKEKTKLAQSRGTEVQMNLAVPEAIYDAFRIKAERQGLSYKQALLRMILNDLGLSPYVSPTNERS